MALSKSIVGIIGGRYSSTTPQAIALAERVGKELGKRGIAIVCGGEDGIMEAASRGCKEAGGVTLGIMKGKNKQLANEYIDYPILTSMDLARNNIIVWTASGLIAFDGMYGTLTEVALVLDIDKPLLIIGNQHLMNIAAIKSPYFSHYSGYDFEQVPGAVDHLLEMIRQYEAHEYL